VAPSFLDQDLSLPEKVEQLCVQRLVWKFAVAALVAAILLRTARFNERRLRFDTVDPALTACDAGRHARHGVRRLRRRMATGRTSSVSTPTPESCTVVAHNLRE